MPSQRKRKKLLQLVDGFKNILDMFEEKRNRKCLHQYYRPHAHHDHAHHGARPGGPAPSKWGDCQAPRLARLLRKRSFFKKFSKARIFEMLEEMDLQLCEAHDLLFFEKDKVYVIVSGNILMKNHDNSIHLPLRCAKFGEGDILNYTQDKIPLFRSLETWFFA